MNHWIKTLLLWLVMAALPLQGFAAAVRISCAPSHHAAVATGHAHTQYQHAEHQHAVHAEHQHHKQAGQHANFDHPVDHSAPSAKLAHDGNTSCSACAACYPGLAMLSPLSIFLPSEPPSQAVLVSPPELVLGYIPPNLERPPRHVFS